MHHPPLCLVICEMLSSVGSEQRKTQKAKLGIIPRRGVKNGIGKNTDPGTEIGLAKRKIRRRERFGGMLNRY